ncbi:hypothetical protein GX48_04924 [Paracoccidioides brasiliensis]|nr:hypothetical protein GX48_04924 [Paracoccidioides brasiliensis]
MAQIDFINECLVYELLGTNIPDTIDAHLPYGRLPGKLAKVIAEQSLIRLDSLHQQNIGHGGRSLSWGYFEQFSSSIDLHTCNLVFTMHCMDNVTEEGFTEMLGKPEIGYVQRSDGKGLEPGIPEYIVRPTSYRTHSWNPAQLIKIIDFVESFFNPQQFLKTLHTPLPVRAPEVIFQDRIDYHVDLWSMGCMVDGKDTINAGESRTTENTGPNLQAWLEEVYFEGMESSNLTREDIVRLGQIIGKLLQFELSVRASARQVLDDPWFNE